VRRGIHHLRSQLVGYIALFISLGGVSYAAAQLPVNTADTGGVSYVAPQLPRNSVGTTQIKNEAVTAAKVRAGSLLARNFASGQLPQGLTGDAGPQGNPGPAGARGADGEPGSQGSKGGVGPKGEPGPQGEVGLRGGVGPKGEVGLEGEVGPRGGVGPKGEPGPRGAPGTSILGSTIPAGTTVYGTWGASTVWPTEPGQAISLTASFPIPAAEPVEAGHIVEGPSEHCLGTAAAPSAASGYVCMYVTTSKETELDPEGPVGRFGFAYKIGGGIKGVSNTIVTSAFGAWAFTAP
jgi:hypothetical protein